MCEFRRRNNWQGEVEQVDMQVAQEQAFVYNSLSFMAAVFLLQNQRL
jgi:hypothetical protein